MLSSSTFAVAGTLATLTQRLETMLASGYHNTRIKIGFQDDISLSDYEEQTARPLMKRKKLTEKEKESLQAEINELRGYYTLANSITSNAKGDALLIALEKGFEKLKELNAPHNMEIIYSDRRDNRLVFAGYCDDGKILDPKQMQRMFELSGENERNSSYYADETVVEKLKRLYAAQQERILEGISIQNSNYFEEETLKLAKWSRDIKIGMERNLREIDKAIDEVNVQLRGRQLTLQKRLELQEQLAVLEPKKKELRMKIYEEQDKIDDERNRLIDETKKKLAQKVESKLIFTVKWRIV